MKKLTALEMLAHYKYSDFKINSSSSKGWVKLNDEDWIRLIANELNYQKQDSVQSWLKTFCSKNRNKTT